MCKTHNEHTHEHEHAHDEAHGHTHSAAEIKAIQNRLSKAIGHLESIKRMVGDGRDCSDVLVQIAAVRSAINATGREILQSHIRHCIVDAVQKGDMNRLEELNFALARLIK